MENGSQEPVVQSPESGAPENDVKVESLSQADRGYKRDMLRYKDEVTGLKEQLKEFQLRDEEKKGNLEGVISKLKDEIRTLKGENAKQKVSFANTQINNAIEKEALSKGCNEKHLDAFMRLIDEDEKGAIALDEAFRVSTEDVASLVEKSMNRYGDLGLFGRKVKVVDATPNNNPTLNTKKEKPIEKMTAAETREYILKNQHLLK